MKELVENGTMKKEELNEFINGRIMKNKKIFQKKELEEIEMDNLLIKKIYLLGILDNM